MSLLFRLVCKGLPRLVVVPRYVKWLLVLILLVGTGGCSIDRHGVIGARFELYDDSPLPSWLELPPGINRDQVGIIVIRYEATTRPKYKVRFVIRDKDRTIWKTVDERIGEGYWHPDSPHWNLPPGSYPRWTIMGVDGINDIYERPARGNLIRIIPVEADEADGEGEATKADGDPH